MAFKLIWSPMAKFDLKDIAAFIAEDSVSAAERFVRSLLQTVERLADFPESGRIVSEFGDPAILEVIRKPCRIVYRVDSRKRIVEIARVWHAARGTPDIQ
ncbi:MAG TPA: plasmid stabilization protein [Desulfotomaculum sp.]|nr:plasmid stabilization protein [Desulfotomaculum sp.]HBY03345.1 plasmid stabilization protein [Desulfotomaculum sp.]